MVIHNTSNHPTHHKHSAFISMLHRLRNIPLDKTDYNNEINTIKYIAQQNGYNHNLVDTLLNNIIKKEHRTQCTNTKQQKYITLTYHNKHTHKIASTFHKLKYKVAYRTTNTVKKHLQPNICSNIDKHQNSGIYKLICNDCPKFYIGQTGRNFQTRYFEHIKDIKNIHPKSSFATHIQDTQHTYTNIDTNLHILHKMHKSTKLNTLEQYEIYKHYTLQPKNILNDHTHFQANTLFEYLTKNTLPLPTT